jgi:pyrroloquinoline quinone biosynthesis protein D
MSTLDPQLRPALEARTRLQIDVVTGEPVLLYPEGLLVLNATAHAIISRMDGIATISAIVKALAEEYDVCAEDLRSDVIECLHTLRARNLVVLASTGGAVLP